MWACNLEITLFLKTGDLTALLNFEERVQPPQAGGSLCEPNLALPLAPLLRGSGSWLLGTRAGLLVGSMADSSAHILTLLLPVGITCANNS